MSQPVAASRNDEAEGARAPPVRSRVTKARFRVHVPSETGGAAAQPQQQQQQQLHPSGAAQSDNGRGMERVWRRVRGGAASASSAAQHVAEQEQEQEEQQRQQQQQQQREQQRGRRRARGPQTIVCGCQVQPCPVHPVLIRVRRSQRPPVPNCDCPPDAQPCPHRPRRVSRRGESGTRRRPQGLSSLFATSSAATAAVLSAGTGQHPHCPHGDDEVCDCERGARPCLHTVKTSRAARRAKAAKPARPSCECPAGQACAHRALEGRIKRVKCRVRRAGCAMARCTAELAMLHLHWQLAGECAPCRPRALTRRLCRRQQSDNELYRSNSFKFERFDRSADDGDSSLRKQVSLCDDYSLPVDFVNKRRPVSVPTPAPTTTVQWTLPSPTIETAEIEVVEQYSDPKDSKNRAYVEPGVDSPQPAIHAKPNRNYCRPYTDPSASGSSCEDEEVTGRLSSARKRKNTAYATAPANRNPSLQAAAAAAAAAAEPRAPSAEPGLLQKSSSGLVVDCVALVHLEHSEHSACSDSLPSRHPSPYYYGDLFKPSAGTQSVDTRHNLHRTYQHQHQQAQHQQLLFPPCRGQPGKYRKSASLDAPAERTRSLGLIPKRNSLTESDGTGALARDAPELPAERQKLSPLEPGADNAAEPEPEAEILSSCIITEWDYTLMPPHRLLSHDLPTTVCTCLASAEEDELETPPPPAPLPPSAPARSSSARHKVRKLRRSRRVEPQPIPIDDRDDEAELEDEGDEEYEDEEEEEEEMARQRQIYETAFDCKVSRSDDDLDDLDRITNHPLLIAQIRNGSAALSRASSSTESSRQSQQTLQQTTHQVSKEHRRKPGSALRPKAPIPSRQQQQQQQPSDGTVASLSQDIEALQMNSNDEKSSSPRASGRGYGTPSPPSTAPLPAKFHSNREHLLLNIRSAPNLPSQQQQEQQQRLKDMRLPVKSSLRAKENSPRNSPQSSENSILEIKGRPKSFAMESKELILEFKGRPLEASPPQRPRPRSLVRESKPIMEFKGRPREAEQSTAEVARARREQQASLLEFKLRTSRRRAGYSSTESMATSSSGGSMESLRSSTSEGNRSTSSSESRHSTSLSSHSSDSGSANCFHHHGHHHGHHHHHQQSGLSSFLTHHATKLHILSPISDKSSQEPASETSDNNRNNNSQKASPEELGNPTAEQQQQQTVNASVVISNPTTPTDTSFKKRRTPQNKNLINLALQSSSSGDAEIQGSDSGISIESRAGIKCNKPFGFQPIKPPQLQLQQQQQQPQLDNINQMLDNEQELSDLPFDMPKLRRRRMLMQQDATTSGSATSVDLKDLPFDMPKLRRRLRCTQSTESSTSQASSSLSVRDVDPPPPLFGGGLARPKMTLNLDGGNGVGNVGLSLAGDAGAGQQQLLGLKKPGGLNLGLSLELTASRGSADLVDVELPLERQGWYHGSITRIEAEAVLRLLREGSYLVRNSESTKQDYSLSLKSARGFMHMRIQKNEELNAYILGQFSKPFDSIPEMVRHFSINRLPIRGAEHMCLLHPVIAQLL